jgi:hypothetical protein
MSGRDLALLKVETTNMPTIPLGNSLGLHIGDRIHVLGYPGAVLTHELLGMAGRTEASVTNGSVSGFKEDRAGQPIIQTDAEAAAGNSGGPAVDDEGRVAGVLTLAAQTAAQSRVGGFNFIIPAQAVREFLAETGADTDRPGRFNEAWYPALRQFFGGDHGNAAKRLAEVNQLVPGLPDVQRVIAQNAERAANRPRRSGWIQLATAFALGGLAVVGTWWLVRWRRNQFFIRPAEVARMLESASPPPLILDVREDGAYEKSLVRIPNARHVTPDSLDTAPSTLSIERTRTVVAYCT